MFKSCKNRLSSNIFKCVSIQFGQNTKNYNLQSFNYPIYPMQRFIIVSKCKIIIQL